MQEKSMNKFRTVVSEVSSFVGKKSITKTKNLQSLDAKSVL